MGKFVVLGLIGFVLAGCAGGREEACELFSPAAIELPTTQDDQRIEQQSSGDPTGVEPQRRC